MIQKCLMAFVCLCSVCLCSAFGANPAVAESSAIPAKPQFEIYCQTPNSFARFYSDDDFVYFSYSDQYGFNNFPVYEGVVTPPMMPFLNQAITELKDFNGYLYVSWPRSKCSFDAARPFLLDCSGRGEIRSPILSKITTSGISISIESTERIDMKYDRLKVNWGLDSEQNGYNHYFLAFPFNRQACHAKHR